MFPIKRGKTTAISGSKKKKFSSTNILGVSLLEILIGITILGFAIGPLLMLFTQGSKKSSQESLKVQALFLTEKILSEIKAGVARRSTFFQQVPINTSFKIVKEDDFTFSYFKGAKFLQLIAGQEPPITLENPFFQEFGRFSIMIENESAGKRLLKVVVTTSWVSRKKLEKVSLTGLIDLIPNEFTGIIK